MQKIMDGRGKKGAFVPAPGLKDFLTEVKAKGIQIGLVTSGLYRKAMPEIVSAFEVMGMGDPFDFTMPSSLRGLRLAGGRRGPSANWP